MLSNAAMCCVVLQIAATCQVNGTLVRNGPRSFHFLRIPQLINDDDACRMILYHISNFYV